MKEFFPTIDSGTKRKEVNRIEIGLRMKSNDLVHLLLETNMLDDINNYGRRFFSRSMFYTTDFIIQLNLHGIILDLFFIFYFLMKKNQKTVIMLGFLGKEREKNV
jgi:hypothetical protein